MTIDRCPRFRWRIERRGAPYGAACGQDRPQPRRHVRARSKCTRRTRGMGCEPHRQALPGTAMPRAPVYAAGGWAWRETAGACGPQAARNQRMPRRHHDDGTLVRFHRSALYLRRKWRSALAAAGRSPEISGRPLSEPASGACAAETIVGGICLRGYRRARGPSSSWAAWSMLRADGCAKRRVGVSVWRSDRFGPDGLVASTLSYR